MPRPQPEIDAETLEHWDQLRAEAREAFDALILSGHDRTSDPLELIVWMSGLPETETLDTLVDRARDTLCTWAQITVALGQPASHHASVANKYRRRR